AALPADARLGAWRDLAAVWPDGRIKLQLTFDLLTLRRSLPGVFSTADYRPLRVSGPAANHVVSFSRPAGAQQAVVAVGRLFHRLGAASTDHLHRPEAWHGKGCRLAVQPGVTFIDALCGRRIVADRNGQLELQSLFDPLPVAVLTA